MSPVRDPDARALRRMQRDRPDGPKSPPPTTPHAGHRKQSADRRLERWNEEELEGLPTHAAGRGRRRAAVAGRLAAARVAAPASAVEVARELVPEPARVVAIGRGPCEVELADGRTAIAHLPKALARAYRATLVVGDEVRLERRSSGELAVAATLPRRNRLSRPDPLDPRRERVLAANLDLALIVACVRRPALSTGLIDRFLVALRHGNVPAAIVVNKADLLEDPEDRAGFLERLDPYRRGGLTVLVVSTRTGEGLESLGALVEGRAVVLLGHSGVGKSSLLNALAPTTGARVGDPSAATGKGRHTTSQARAYRLAGSTRVVDTPGVREFGLWQLSPRELAAYFDELAPFAEHCRFNDCTHREEPRCAVRAAAEEDPVVAERYATYRRLLESLERD